MKETLYKKIIEKQDELIRFLTQFYSWKYFDPSAESEVVYANYKQEIAELIAELEKRDEPIVYHGCDHPEKYRFIDKDGYLRCSDCHKVIEQIKPQTKL